MVADVVDGLTGGERRVENVGLVSPEEAEELDLVGEGERRTPGAEAARRCPARTSGAVCFESCDELSGSAGWRKITVCAWISR